MNSTPIIPFGTPELGPDAIRDAALVDLHAYLTGIARIDPSNTGSDGRDEERYAHRHVLVLQAVAAALAAGLAAGIAPAADDGWPVVFVELPDGTQLSWHCPAYSRPYDGHTTEEKYTAIRRWSAGFREASQTLHLAAGRA